MTRNLLGEARLMRALDLVISVDTMPAHLAGALGMPVWTLLPTDADWRWMVDRDDSPWYPTMRLFRQTQDGAWEPVIRRVATALEQLFTSVGMVRETKAGGSLRLNKAAADTGLAVTPSHRLE
jgi:ADP-heptose:LPS heptosyltransferase